MSQLDPIPAFPRGFQLSVHDVTPPPSYVPGPLLPNFYVHRWTPVNYEGDTDLFVIILGYCLSTSPSDLETDSASRLLAYLREGHSQFLKAVESYSGRYAIIYGSRGDIKIVNDATGMRSVFYSTSGEVVASHALLVEKALGGTILRNDLPYRYGYPGNRTPYSRTKLLTPNTYYWLTANITIRFWPFVPPPQLSVKDAATKALDAATRALERMATNRTVRLSLTAGIDSRTILAVALNSGITFDTYTYGDGADTRLDRSFAADLSGSLGLRHSTIPRPEQPRVLNERLADAHYHAHHAKQIQGLYEYFNDPHAVALSGNLLEIGRAFYHSARRSKVAKPLTAESMAKLHHRAMGNRSKNIIAKYGIDKYLDQAIPAFQGFIEDTGYEHSAGMLDPFDQFYWEHRMSAWHGTAMNERDFYAEAFIPFNARAIFETLVGVPYTERQKSAVFYRMIEMVDSRLLDFPVNPKTWPRQGTSQKSN